MVALSGIASFGVGMAAGAVGTILVVILLPDRPRERFWGAMERIRAAVMNPSLRARSTWTYEVIGELGREGPGRAGEEVREAVGEAVAQFHPLGSPGHSRSKSFDLVVKSEPVRFGTTVLDTDPDAPVRVQVTADCALHWRGMEGSFLQLEQVARTVETAIMSRLHARYLGFSVFLEFPKSVNPLTLIDRNAASYASGKSKDDTVTFHVGQRSLEATGAPTASLAAILRPAVSRAA